MILWRYLIVLIFGLLKGFKLACKACTYQKLGYYWYTALIPFYCNIVMFDVTRIPKLAVAMQPTGILTAPYMVLFVQGRYKMFRRFGLSIVTAVIGCVFPIVAFARIAFSAECEFGDDV